MYQPGSVVHMRIQSVVTGVKPFEDTLTALWSGQGHPLFLKCFRTSVFAEFRTAEQLDTGISVGKLVLS